MKRYVKEPTVFSGRFWKNEKNNYHLWRKNKWFHFIPWFTKNNWLHDKKLSYLSLRRLLFTLQLVQEYFTLLYFTLRFTNTNTLLYELRDTLLYELRIRGPYNRLRFTNTLLYECLEDLDSLKDLTTVWRGLG